MLILFTLILTSSAGFSLYLWALPTVVNPLVYVLIGWGPPVLAYILSQLFDRIRLNVLNRTYKAFIVNHQGLCWTGQDWEKDGACAKFFYNTCQVESEVRRIHENWDDDVYVRIMLPEEFELEEEEDEE